MVCIVSKSREGLERKDLNLRVGALLVGLFRETHLMMYIVSRNREGLESRDLNLRVRVLFRETHRWCILFQGIEKGWREGI